MDENLKIYALVNALPDTFNGWRRLDFLYCYVGRHNCTFGVEGVYMYYDIDYLTDIQAIMWEY